MCLSQPRSVNNAGIRFGMQWDTYDKTYVLRGLSQAERHECLALLGPLSILGTVQSTSNSDATGKRILLLLKIRVQTTKTYVRELPRRVFVLSLTVVGLSLLRECAISWTCASDWSQRVRSTQNTPTVAT